MAPIKRTQDVISDGNLSFSSLLLSKHISDGLKVVGFTKPSPVQMKSIPFGKCGLDLIVQAKSGTGKTCVFAIVALEMVSTTSFEVQAIVLAPTREIAAQIHEFFCKIGSRTDDFHCNMFIGGTAVEDDKKKLSKCQIVIGTPGRVKALIDCGLLQTRAINLFVLDEADKLLEPGSFQDQINWIYSTLPMNKQVLALSATYPEYLAKHLTNYMNDPVHIRLNSEAPTLIGIKQLSITVEPHHLPHVVFEQKAKKLAKFLRRYPFQQCMVFSNYQARAKLLADMLSMLGWPASCIAGNQPQTDRFEAMKQLKDFKCRILISTDLTSRGIDCDKVDLVINLDLPWDTETYLHRVGRAGRFGNYGLAVSFVSRGKEERKLQDIAREIKYKIGEISDLSEVGSIFDTLSNPWHSNQDSKDVRDTQLSGESAQRPIHQDQPDNEGEFDHSNCSDREMSLLESAQNIVHDSSTTSKDLLVDVTNAMGMNGLECSSNVNTSLVELHVSSDDLPDHSKDLSGLTQSVGRTNSESLHRQLNSLPPFGFNVCSNSTSTKDLDCDLTPIAGRAARSSDVRDNIQKDALSNKNGCEFHLVANCGVSAADNQEQGEQSMGFPPKEDFGLIDAELLTVRDGREVNRGFMISDSKSLGSSSERDKREIVARFNEVDGNLEGRLATGKDGEIQEENRCCDKSKEFNKRPREIRTLELEVMLGDLVCDRLIESGTHMLNDYYSSRRALPKSIGTACFGEDMITSEATVKQDESYEHGMRSDGLKDNLAVHDAKIISKSSNQHETQEILCGIKESIGIAFDSGGDIGNVVPTFQNNDEELLLFEERLNESETIISESEDNALKSEQDLSESLRNFHTSARFINGLEAAIYKSQSRSDDMCETRTYKDSFPEDNMNMKSDTMMEKKFGESIESVLGLPGSTSSEISPLKMQNPSQVNSRPAQTDLQATDEDSNDLAPTDTRRDMGADSLCHEKGDEALRGHDQAPLETRDHFSRCSRCDEIREKDWQRFKKGSMKCRKPKHGQNLGSSRFPKGTLHTMKEVSFNGDPVLVGNDKYNGFYGVWYDIYRKQTAWMNYHSWQYQRSTTYINEMCSKYWQ